MSAYLRTNTSSFPITPVQGKSNLKLHDYSGFMFRSMDYLTVCATPSVPTVDLSEPLIAVPAIPNYAFIPSAPIYQVVRYCVERKRTPISCHFRLLEVFLFIRDYSDENELQ